jgi:hypothetical protein
MTLETATTEELLAELRRRLEHVPTPPKSRCEREFLRMCSEIGISPEIIKAHRRDSLFKERQRMAESLKWAGFTASEIGEVMNRTPGAIKLRLHPKRRKPNDHNSRDDAPGWVQPRK